jgi:hypothetical protein
MPDPVHEDQDGEGERREGEEPAFHHVEYIMIARAGPLAWAARAV